MIEALIIAMIYIAIVCVIGYAILALVPVPPPVKVVIQALIAVICLIILLQVFVGDGLYFPLHHRGAP